MENKTHPHAALIDAIGREPIRLRFKVSRQLVHLWRERGIPAKRWVAIRNLAIEHDVPISFETLARGLSAKCQHPTREGSES